MKHITLVALVAITSSTAACIANPDEDTIADEGEMVAEASDALTEIVTMGSLGWADQSAWSTDLVLGHRVLNVKNKWAAVQSMATFPTLTGAYTAVKAAQCSDSYLDVWVYKRPGSSGSWTQFDHHKVFATPTVSGGQITSCAAVFEMDYCDSYIFPIDNEMEVDLVASGGDGSTGNKSNIVRYPVINLATCP